MEGIPDNVKKLIDRATEISRVTDAAVEALAIVGIKCNLPETLHLLALGAIEAQMETYNGENVDELHLREEVVRAVDMALVHSFENAREAVETFVKEFDYRLAK